MCSIHRLAFAAGMFLSPACSQEGTPPKNPAVRDAAKDAAVPSGEFLRFIDLGDYRGRLEVAIARYGDKERGITVDLVSAVHVGEKAYYEDLQRRFKDYDAVLYELVAPEGTVPDAGAERGFNPVSMLQQGMKRMLDLDFQLEAIDYDQKNFVHADLSAADIARAWKDRGESLISALWQMMTSAMRVQQERYDAEAEKAEAEAKKDGKAAAEPEKPRGREAKRRAMKWALAKELGPMEEMLAMFGGDDKGSGSVLLGERNKRAVEVLAREIAKGKKKLAIFYGGAHMPDIATRLIKDLGLERQGAEWVVAWDVGGK